MTNIIKNYREIVSEINKFHKKFSLTSKNPKLIAVSKTFPEEVIQKIINQGHKIFGENKVQEAALKWKSLKNINKEIELHLIGPLQSNKVSLALEVFDVIQTIDREKIVKKIKSQIDENFPNKNFKFFIQVNIGGEKQKSGVSPSHLKDFLGWCVNDINLSISGLMCIPPVDQDSSYFFNLLRNLCDQFSLNDASMGMSSDYDKAIQFGATYLRIGSGIFGKRV